MSWKPRDEILAIVGAVSVLNMASLILCLWMNGLSPNLEEGLR